MGLCNSKRQKGNTHNFTPLVFNDTSQYSPQDCYYISAEDLDDYYSSMTVNSQFTAHHDH